MTTPSLRFLDAARTDPGKKRAVNEDSYLAAPELGLWLVADGMGGHENGQWASSTLAEALGQVRLTGAFDADARIVADGLHAANLRIFGEATALGKSMGTTAVALLINDTRFAVLWAGDSRGYVLRSGLLHQLTRDHTQVQEMVDRGLLSAEDAAQHPMSHVITRAVGVEADLEVDAVADEAQAGDVFLLCSDGLCGVLADAEIAATLATCRPSVACDRLLEMSLERGAPDNVTLIAVACEQVTQLTLPPSEA